MKRSGTPIIVACCLALVSGVWFCAVSSAADRDLAAVLSTDHVTRTVLDNGLTLLVKPDRRVPLVSIVVLVGTGSALEGPYAGSGISHLLEHMLFKGTADRPAAWIEQDVKSWGGQINAFTSFDLSGYWLSLRAEYAAEGIALLADIFSRSTFPEAELIKEKEVILNEMSRRNDSPGIKMITVLFETMFRYHPYRYPIIGYPELFGQITRDALIGYYRQRYVPNGTVIAVVGDVDPDACRQAVTRAFGPLARGTYQPYRSVPEPAQLSTRTVVTPYRTTQAYVAFGFHGCAMYDPDLYALDVLATALTDGDSAVLAKVLIREKRLAYTVSGAAHTLRDGGVFGISCIADPSSVPLMTRVLRDELGKVREQGLAPSDITRAKRLLETDVVRGYQTIQEQAQDLAGNEMLLGDIGYTQRYLAGIRDVTNEEIVAAARRYLTENNMTVVQVVPQDDRDLSGTQEPDPAPYEPRLSTLSNGTRVITCENRLFPVVSLRASLRGGALAETDTTSGISNLTANMLLRGTHTRSEEQLIDLVESWGGRMYPFSGNNSFGVGIETGSDECAMSIDLLADVIGNPEFPETVLDREKSLITSQIRAEDDDIFRYGFHRFKELLYGDHPYHRRHLGTVETIGRLGRDDLAAFYAQQLDPRNLVISIVGDIDTPAVLPHLEERIGSLPVPAARAGEPVAVPMRAREVVLPVDKEQSLVIIGFPGTTVDGPDRYALDVLASVLSGSDGRLFFKLRGKLGVGYTLAALNVPAIDPGYFAVCVATSRKYIPLVKKILHQELSAVTRTLEPQEVAWAKASLVAENLNQQQTAGGLNAVMSLDELYRVGFDRYQRLPQLVDALTPGDIVRAARAYLKKDRMICVILEGTE